MNKKVISIFFDTNIFLHFKFISEINWIEIFPDVTVNYLIASCILKELDEQKYKGISKRERNRAKNILERFYKATEQGEGKLDNIKIEFLTSEPTKNTFENNNLSETNSDDRLLASILEFSSKGSSVCLITNDLALILKARNLNIDVKRLDEKYKLSDELDENEKIIMQLRKENLELKERKPNLRLVFENEEVLKEFTLNQPRDFSNYVNDQLVGIKSKYKTKILEEENKVFSISKLGNLFTTPISKLTFGREYEKEEIDSYNRKLNQFYSEYHNYLNDYVSFLKFNETILNLKLYLYNFGNIAAKNIRISLHFPDGFELLRKNETMSEPRKPHPPELRSPFPSLDFFNNRDLINSSILSSIQMPRQAYQMDIPNVSKINIKKTNSYDVDTRVQNCPHRHKEKILSLFLKFENVERANSFNIDYQLIADDIPDFVRGMLNIKIIKIQNC
jgi:hypothetical protein